MFGRWVVLAASALCIVATVGADDFVWDGGCGADQEWEATCSGQTNWNQGVSLPGATDAVSVSANHSGTTITTYDVEVYSADVQASMTISEKLELHANSELKDLILAPSGEIKTSLLTTAVTLSGTPTLAGNFYGPGSFGITGNANLNGLRVRDFAVAVNTASATLSTAALTLTTLAGFLNQGSLDIYNGSDINGSGVTFENRGEVTAHDGIVQMWPDYNQNNGVLDVRGGVFELRSGNFSFVGGTIVLAQGSELKILGQPGNRGFSGIQQITGSGVLDLSALTDVHSDLKYVVGSANEGIPGEVILRGTQNLHADLSNHGRFRFHGGVLDGSAEDRFTNKGLVYTGMVGSAGVECGVTNEGMWENRSSLDIAAPYEFLNHIAGTVRLLPPSALGDGVTMSGGGLLFNQGRVILEANDVAHFADVTVRFNNQGGEVVARRGRLLFRGVVDNLVSSKLKGGIWRQEDGGCIVFPEPVLYMEDVKVKTVGGNNCTGLEGVTKLESGAHFECVDQCDEEVVPDGDGSLDTEGQSRIDVDETSELKVQGDCAFENQSAAAVGGTMTCTGDCTLNGHSGFSVGGHLECQSGITVDGDSTLSVESDGTVMTPLLNSIAGWLRPGGDSIGDFMLDGDLVLGAAGVLDINVSDLEADLFTVNGDVTLGGTLKIRSLPPPPDIGSNFTIMTATGTITGEFDKVIGDEIVIVDYQPGSLSISIVATNQLFWDGFESSDTSAWSATSP